MRGMTFFRLVAVIVVFGLLAGVAVPPLIGYLMELGLGLRVLPEAALGKVHAVVQLGHAGRVEASAFSPDGKVLLSGGAEGTAKLWDMETGREIRTLPGGDGMAVTAVAFHPDGTHILIGTEGGTVTYWDATTGTKVRVFDSLQQRITGVMVTADGKLALGGTEGGMIGVWELRRGFFFGYLGNDNGVRGMAAAPDGRYFLTADGNGATSLWNVESRRVEHEFEGIGDVARAVAISSDGRLAATGFQGGSVRVWDVATGDPLWTAGGKGGAVVAIAFAGDGRRLLVAAEDGSIVWRAAADGGAEATLRRPGGVAGTTALSPDGRLVVVGEGDGPLGVLAADDGRVVRRLVGHAPAVGSLVLAGDGRRLLAGNANGQVSLWDLRDGHKVRDALAHRGAVRALALAEEAGRVFSGGDDGMLAAFDLESGRSLARIKAHPGGVRTVGASPDGRVVVSGGAEGAVTLWDVASGKALRSLRRSGPAVRSLALGPSGRIVAAGDEEGGVTVWDAASGRILGKVALQIDAIGALAFSPDGRGLLVGQAGQLGLWQADTLSETRSLIGHTGLVEAARFLQGGAAAVSAARDGRVILWDLGTGGERRSFEGHLGAVEAVAVAPDGRRMVSAGADGTLRLWDLESGREVVRLLTAADGEWIAATPDGYYVNSPEGGGLIHYASLETFETYSFEQFEPFIRRPDIITKRLAGDAGAGVPTPRLNRPPRIEVAGEGSRIETRETSLALDVAIPAKSGAHTVRVFVNGKPAAERRVEREASMLRLEVPLYAGANRVTVVAHDAEGYSSNLRQLDVAAGGGGLRKPDLYVLAVGASAYPKLPERWQLDFAHSDARNLSDTLRRQEGRAFNHVYRHVLLNEQVGSASIARALTALQEMDAGDVAVVFMAGHGVQDREGRFYFLTPEGRIEEPREGGIDWSELGRHLARIKGRTILFLDACHSGSVVTEAVAQNDRLAQRFFQEGSGGVMVFSASKGRQESMESPDVGGGFGVFTFGLIQGLEAKARDADRNGDGFVEFLELVDWVTHYVDRETAGQQTPWLSRKEMFGDLPMAKVTARNPGH